MNGRKYKILMVAMSMNYGGAETHIYELVKYFNSQNTSVILVSGGGVYSDELQKLGIIHIEAPLHSRAVSSMVKSAKIIKKLISEHSPDVVHSHARIPSFICSKICKKLKIPLVTTVHGAFSLSFPLKHLTNWGDYVLAVSEDIRDYLINNYNYARANIRQTVNAINSENFHSDKSNSKIRREFNVKESEKIILTVSRLDRQSSLAAFKLCEISEKLYKYNPDSKIIIVGSGEVFESVQKEAEKANRKIGKDYVIITGGRSDIYNFTQTADVFVGISRAALEALSSGLPTVLCGDMGWLGRFKEENVDECIATNFTCRGFDYPENVNDKLYEDIVFCLDEKNKSEIDKNINIGTELIKNNYSMQRMANDAYAAYETALLKYKPYDFIITGYYGHYNMGDDALLFTILNNIRMKDELLKICILASSPKKLQNRINQYFPNADVKHRFNFLKLKSVMKSSNAFMFGGGTLIQDNTSTKSLLYYLYLLKTAKKLKLKTFLYANGINIGNQNNIEKVAKVMKSVDFTTVRDAQSYNFLVELGIDKNKLKLTADEAMTVECCDIFNVRDDYFKTEASKIICICVRKWKTAKSLFFEEFLLSINSICKKYNLIPVYVVMEPENDSLVSQNLSEYGKNTKIVEYNGNIGHILSVIKSSDFVISMRLHMLIFGMTYEKPVIGISYDPKVRNTLYRFFGKNDYSIELESFDKETLIKTFDIIYENRKEIVEEIKKYKDANISAAKENAEIFARKLKEQ